MDYRVKKQLTLLIKIALVDEEFADSEKEMILDIGHKYGASDEEIKELFNSPPTDESLAPMTVIEKTSFMIDCVLVILADKVVTSSEEYFGMQIAKRLGFKPEVIPFLIENKDKSREEMQELMLPFLVV